MAGPLVVRWTRWSHGADAVGQLVEQHAFARAVEVLASAPAGPGAPPVGIGLPAVACARLKAAPKDLAAPEFLEKCCEGEDGVRAIAVTRKRNAAGPPAEHVGCALIACKGDARLMFSLSEHARRRNRVRGHRNLRIVHDNTEHYDVVWDVLRTLKKRKRDDDDDSGGGGGCGGGFDAGEADTARSPIFREPMHFVVTGGGDVPNAWTPPNATDVELTAPRTHVRELPAHALPRTRFWSAARRGDADATSALYAFVGAASAGALDDCADWSDGNDDSETREGPPGQAWRADAALLPPTVLRDAVAWARAAVSSGEREWACVTAWCVPGAPLPTTGAFGADATHSGKVVHRGGKPGPNAAEEDAALLAWRGWGGAPGTARCVTVAAVGDDACICFVADAR